MNIIQANVNFEKGRTRLSGIDLVSGDYASTKIVFDFDRQNGTKIFELKSPSNELVLMSEIENNELLLCGYDEHEQPYSLFNEAGEYVFEISLYEDGSKLTSAYGTIQVEKEQVQISDEVVEVYIPIFDQLMNELDSAIAETENLNIEAEKVDNVTTITITKKDGTAETTEILDGEKGETGDKGEKGEDAKINGVNTLTIEAGTNISLGQEGSTLTINNTYDDSEILNDISDLETNKADKTEIPDVSNFITKDVNNLTYYTLKTNTGSLIDLEINGTTYVVTLSLKDQDGNTISTDTIDLPLESVVVGGSYDSTNKKIVLTLENGNTVDIPVGDLVAGLQTELSSTNKLNADYVDDTNSGNKFTNTSEKTSWNAKYDKPANGIPSTDMTSEVQTSLGKADTAIQNTDYATGSTGGVIKVYNSRGLSMTSDGGLQGTTINYDNYGSLSNGAIVSKGTLENVIAGKNLETANNKVTSVDNTSTDVQYPSAKCVYDSQEEQNEAIDEAQRTAEYNETIENALPKVSGTGTFVSLDGTAEESPLNIVLSPSELEQATTTGKNLANITVIPHRTNPDLTVANNTITLSNNTNANGFTNSNKTLSQLCPSLSVDDVVYLFFDTTSTSVYKNDIYITEYWEKGTSKTITQSLLNANVSFYGGYNETAVISNFMITKVNDSTYEPYTGGIASPNPDYPQEIHTVSGDNEITISNSDNTKTQTLPLNLGDLEYCKIGNYADEFYKATASDTSLQEGKWYLKKIVKKETLTSSLDWLKSNTTDDDRFFLESYFISSRNNRLAIAKCNYYRVVTSTTTDIGTIRKNGNQLVINHSTYNTTTIDDFKDWLNEHNVIIYNILNSPTYTLLNDTLQTQLDDIYNWAKSYQKQTNISQTNNDLPFVISANAIAYEDLDKTRSISGYYGTCGTGANTSEKVVTCDNFILKTGAVIFVRFTNANSYNGTATLNVNNTGAINITRNLTTTTRHFWKSGEVVGFAYNGTSYDMVQKSEATSTYYGLVKLLTSATSTSDATALTPKALNSYSQNMISDCSLYSSSSTYEVGDRVRYSYNTYECNTAITTAESWNSEHWTALDPIQTQIDNINTVVQHLSHETWTFTLSDDSTVTKEIVLW